MMVGPRPIVSQATTCKLPMTMVAAPMPRSTRIKNGSTFSRLLQRPVQKHRSYVGDVPVIVSRDEDGEIVRFDTDFVTRIDPGR